MSEWDRFKGDFVKFENVGDGIRGVVRSLTFDGSDFNGKDCPKLVIEEEDGSVRTVTAGQVMLQRTLAEKQPDVGDKISIVYSGNGEGKPGRAPAKLFDVEVTKAGADPGAASSGVAASNLV